MRSWIVWIVLSLVAGQAFATAQFPERLYYGGETLELFAEPLEQLFTGDHPKPAALPSGPVCSACWRGYIGTWKIEEGFLYLVGLQQGIPEGEEIPVSAYNNALTRPVI